MSENQTHNISWMFSIINESDNDYFWKNLELLQEMNQTVCVVDGGSVDETKTDLKKRKITFHDLPESTRGQRFEFGARQTQASILIFVHPRTRISPEVIRAMQIDLPSHHSWGAFTHRFDTDHIILRFTSWWSNTIRGDLRGIFYLDHVLWVRRSLLTQAGGFPAVAIFEDTILCERLLRFGKPIRLPQTTVTSAVRFRKNGLTKQIMINQLAKLRYYLRQNNDSINRKYESGFDLNGKNSPQGQQLASKIADTDQQKN